MSKTACKDCKWMKQYHGCNIDVGNMFYCDNPVCFDVIDIFDSFSGEMKRVKKEKYTSEAPPRPITFRILNKDGHCKCFERTGQ